MNGKSLVPLPLQARRLAPFVANGMISHREAHDTLMEHIVRYRWKEYCATTEQQLATEQWLDAVIALATEEARIDG